MVNRFCLAAMAGLAMLGGGAAAQEGPCAVESATLNFGQLQALRAGWQPGVGEVVVRCRNAGTASRTFRIAVALADDQPLENAVDPRAPALKVRFFEDPGYRMRWGGLGGRHEGKAVGVTVDGRSQETVRVPVYGLIFVPNTATAGDYFQSVRISLRYDG